MSGSSLKILFNFFTIKPFIFLIMMIKTYLNCTEQEIQSKKYNIFVGISLGNKYFTKETIKKYILWALEKYKR